jgi:hypothetical protein
MSMNITNASLPSQLALEPGAGGCFNNFDAMSNIGSLANMSPAQVGRFADKVYQKLDPKDGLAVRDFLTDMVRSANGGLRSGGDSAGGKPVNLSTATRELLDLRNDNPGAKKLDAAIGKISEKLPQMNQQQFDDAIGTLKSALKPSTDANGDSTPGDIDDTEMSMLGKQLDSTADKGDAACKGEGATGNRLLDKLLKTFDKAMEDGKLSKDEKADLSQLLRALQFVINQLSRNNAMQMVQPGAQAAQPAQLQPQQMMPQQMAPQQMAPQQAQPTMMQPVQQAAGGQMVAAGQPIMAQPVQAQPVMMMPVTQGANGQLVAAGQPMMVVPMQQPQQTYATAYAPQASTNQLASQYLGQSVGANPLNTRGMSYDPILTAFQNLNIAARNVNYDPNSANMGALQLFAYALNMPQNSAGPMQNAVSTV